MRLYCRTLLHLALAVLCNNAVLVMGICSQGFVDINGQCAPQSNTCPQNYGLLNGMCYPATTTTTQCPNGQVPVNGQCCTYECNLKCPTQTSPPCPNQPLLPNQPVTPNQPLMPCPNQPVVPCPNQPILPIQPTSPCPNQPISPCPNQPVLPIQPIAPCPNQPVTPYPNQPVTPYPNQPITPNQPVSPCPNQPVLPIQPIAPCPNQPVLPNTPAPPCPSQPLLPYPTHPTITTPTPPTIIVTTTAPPPPPAQIIRCPEGTILIGGACRLIYCGKGVFMNKRCIQTECPKLTVWTGIQCAPQEPIVHSIVFNNTVITHFNRTEPDVIVNNVNNMLVNASIALPLHQLSQLPPTSIPCGQNQNSEENCNTLTESTQAPPDQSKCCTVMTPRMCRQNSDGNRWNCYNRRYRRCGEFCIAPTIYLRAPQPRQTGAYMVLPPDLGLLSDCRRSHTCPESQDLYNCSGCATGHAESCSSYCYQYLCPKQSCSFYDQRDYCSSQLSGQYGCQEQDGCQEPWCSGTY